MKMPVLGSTQPAITNRPLDMLATDTAAVRAIAQAAVSVELFTIPLYMATMYSIQGTHQINSKGITYYEGRQWPGMGTTARPELAEQKAFNIIFSVFIQEMLHLQMAANLATAIGTAPCFTGSELQSQDHGWTCYGKDCTVIPHIVDLQDTADYRHVRVNLEELNANQCDLFLAIEQPEEQARAQLAKFDSQNHTKYFPEVPLPGWTPGKHVHDLPLFGTIGYMYECYARYISIEYTDGQTLWHKLFVNGSVQQDMFNSQVQGHAKAEFPKFDTCFGPQDQDGGQTGSFNKAIDMMAAITDQGEGSATAIQRYRRDAAQRLMAVQPDYREDLAALKCDYPSYANNGKDAESRDAQARHDSAPFDHYERFGQVKAMLPVKTWAGWHQEGGRWSEAMLTNERYNPATAP
ncbi:MAG: ferritin-like domain-containing protein, partial [Janthinobacterium sp.]